MIIGYLRVSTDEQAQSGLGLDAQLESITCAIARELEKQGIKSKTGKTTWHPNSVRKMLSTKHGENRPQAEREAA